ncbi:GNAT family N-acetyltransferase [Lacrimispora indolis]|uniref:GNAT family N-acetyltransferase n=1 Tax=Lacrimispora indolis TaxID=69825 RepID=UPI00045E5CD4|nr:GNAT family N-acetyltransferase [Lacrimispora indolis]
MIIIRYVQEEDKDFWFKLDKHLPQSEFEKKIRDKMGYVLLENNIPTGLLRYNLFWDNIPFCTMLYIQREYQHKGYGSKLVKFWEENMKAAGYELIMTSTQVDEDAQHFYRKIGYHDSGGLIIDVPNFKQPMEIFFVKVI